MLHRAIWGAGLFLLAVVAALGYGRWASAREIRALEPPGRILQIEGRGMHVHCTGNGSPTIWVDAGNASYSLDWAAVQPRLARLSRTCTYDRAGYGWSEPGPAPRDARRVVSELRGVVQGEVRAGTVGGEDDARPNGPDRGGRMPIILVGHSLGGLHALLYTATDPGRVAGLVLLDPAAPELVRSPEFLRTQRASMGYYRVMGVLTGTGLLRALGPLFGEGSLPETARRIPGVRAEYLTLSLDPAFWQTAMAELEQTENSARQVESALGSVDRPLDDLPLIVLSADDDPEEPKDAEGSESLRRKRISAHERLAELSTRGRHRIVPNAGHRLHLDAPDAVLDAVQEILRELDSSA